jgi:hypothetical protein
MNNAEYLWNLFVDELGEIGTAAVLGNLKAESAMLTHIVHTCSPRPFKAQSVT